MRVVAQSRQTFWLKLNFSLPKNESVLNISGYFLKQFQIYPKIFSTDFILLSGWIQAAMQQNTSLALELVYLYGK